MATGFCKDHCHTYLRCSEGKSRIQHTQDIVFSILGEKNTAKNTVFNCKERKMELAEITHEINHPGLPILLGNLWPEWPHPSIVIT